MAQRGLNLGRLLIGWEWSEMTISGGRRGTQPNLIGSQLLLIIGQTCVA